MTGGVVVARRVAIFATILGLGLLLAYLLDERGTVARARPVLPVVDVPPGTPVGGSGTAAGIRFHWARGSDVGPVEEIALDDGTRVPFRASRIRADSAAPLPSPSPDVSRQALEHPSLEMRPRPRTREDLDRPAHAGSVVAARRGILEQGPGEARRLFLDEDVRAELRRGEVPWSFRAATAEVDLLSRVVRVPGAVVVESKGVALHGEDLLAEEGRHTAHLDGPGNGRVDCTSGIALGGDGGEDEPPVLLRWREGLRIEMLPSVPGAATADSGARYRLSLDGDAVIEQGDAILRARRVTAVLVRARTDPEAAPPRPAIESMDAEGDVVLEGGAAEPGGARSFHAASRTLRAAAGEGGTTVVTLEGAPAVRMTETRNGRTVGAAGASSTGPAVVTLPPGRESVSARFTGRAAAWHEVSATDGAPGARRDLRADTIVVVADRDPADGRHAPRELVAEGSADLRDGAGRAAAGRIVLRPLPDGGSSALFERDVTATVPAAGAMDPLSVLGRGGGSRADGAAGALLVASPGSVEVALPAGGGGTIIARDGVVIRRVVDEREVYALAADLLQADLHGPGRVVRLLDARGAARVTGERAGGGRYDLSGERLLVSTSDGGERPDAARIEAGPARPASVVLRGADARPLRLAGSALRIDRATGRFRADGPVSGEGVLPERAGSTAGPTGAATLEAGTVDGVLVEEAGGVTGVRELRATGGVRLLAGIDAATGDSLDYDAPTGTCVLRGTPARVVAATRHGAPGQDLRDRCEAPVLRLRVEGGALREATAEAGGVVEFHRVADGGASGPPRIERVRASCQGPLRHREAATHLERAVSLSRSLLVDGSWTERERLDDADRLDVEHAPAADGTRTLGKATATSAASRLRARDAGSGWAASGVSRAVLEGDRVLLEAAAGAPRFRVEHASGVHEYRRVVFDHVTRAFVEAIGASVVER